MAASVYTAMAALSLPGATFSTFTAAGDVRRGLEAAGFSVSKRAGFGSKRDALCGFIGNPTQRRRPSRLGTSIPHPENLPTQW
ncbi:MAG: hypothetical protein CM15mP74_04890 [Halieaceae bacterium]|nr:MAG: hypothetical protein CM15mP74_04890 [Halieaceae bacterium]